MNKQSQTKEPLLRIAKRDNFSKKRAWLVRVVAIAASLILCAGFIYSITGINPLNVYKTMIKGAFGTNSKIWSTIRDSMFLLCVSVALAPAFKMRFWNIGAEGQVLVGGIASAACMIYFGNNIPTFLLFIIMFVTSCTAGALWGCVPAIFKSKWNTNETLFTLMMNYLAIQLTAYFVSIWENPYGSNTVGIINPSTKAGWFPALFGQRYFLNVAIVMTITVIMYFYLKYSKQGYEISVVGESENTARYAGINVPKVFIRTMLVSGALCGLAGFITVSGSSHTISINTAGGNGFTAIIVAWLSKFNTFVMILVSFMLVFLDKGAIQIATECGLNEYASEIIEGIILFFILGSEFFINYKIIGRKKAEKGA